MCWQIFYYLCFINFFVNLSFWSSLYVFPSSRKKFGNAIQKVLHKTCFQKDRQGFLKMKTAYSLSLLCGILVCIFYIAKASITNEPKPGADSP